MSQQEFGSQIKDILEHQRIKGNWPLKRILYILTQLTEYDLVIEKKLKKYQGLLIACYILGFLTIFPAAILGSVEIAFLIPLFFVLGIVFTVIYFRKKKCDLQNDFREFLEPLLEVLKDDLKPDSKIALDIHISPTECKENYKGVSDKYSKGAYYKCYDYLYKRDWLTLVLALQDGNRLTLLGHELLIKMKKTKRNPRGKIKTKVKYKKKVTFDIRLRFKPQKYDLKQLPSNGDGPDKQKFSLKESTQAKILRLRYMTKLKGELIPSWQKTIEKVVTLYSYLIPKQSGPTQ